MVYLIESATFLTVYWIIKSAVERDRVMHAAEKAASLLVCSVMLSLVWGLVLGLTLIVNAIHHYWD